MVLPLLGIWLFLAHNLTGQIQKSLRFDAAIEYRRIPHTQDIFCSTEIQGETVFASLTLITSDMDSRL